MGIVNIIICGLFYKCVSVIFGCFVKFPCQLLVSSLKFVYSMHQLCCKSRRYDVLSHASAGSDRGAAIVSQPRSFQCQDCSTLKREKEQLQKQFDTLKATEKSLQCGKKEIEHKYEKLKERSDKLTKEMASVFNERTDFENINDEFSNTRLSKRFRHLYDDTWTTLSEWIEENIPDLEERDRISKLTCLMKDGYNRCTKMAEGELRTFLFLGDKDILPSRKEDPALYNLRRKYGQTKVKREGIVKIIFEELTEKEELKSMLPEEEQAKSKGLDMMRKFFCDYIECCWLMTISHQRLVLDFEVIDYKYTDNYIKVRFTVFPCQDNVVDKTRPKDTVVEVVWPSVELENGTGIYAKGDVIIVDVGKDQPHTENVKKVSDIRHGAPLLESDNNTSDMGNGQPYAESDKNASGMGNGQPYAESDNNASGMGNGQPYAESDDNASGMGNGQPYAESDDNASGMGNGQPYAESDDNASGMGNGQPYAESDNNSSGMGNGQPYAESDDNASGMGNGQSYAESDDNASGMGNGQPYAESDNNARGPLNDKTLSKNDGGDINNDDDDTDDDDDKDDTSLLLGTTGSKESDEKNHREYTQF